MNLHYGWIYTFLLYVDKKSSEVEGTKGLFQLFIVFYFDVIYILNVLCLLLCNFMY